MTAPESLIQASEYLEVEAIQIAVGDMEAVKTMTTPPCGRAQGSHRGSGGRVRSRHVCDMPERS